MKIVGIKVSIYLWRVGMRNLIFLKLDLPDVHKIVVEKLEFDDLVGCHFELVKGQLE